MAATYDYEEVLLLKTAWYYYMEGLTQQEIGAQLGIPRLRVNRLLDKARKKGMVQFSIRSGHESRLELEQQLTQVFGLRDAFVAPEPTKSEDTNENVALAAASYIHDRLGRQDFLNMGYGDTMGRVLNHLATMSEFPVNVVSLTGGVSYYLPNVQSSVFNVKLHLIPTPLLMQSPEVVQAMKEEPKVKEILDLIPLARMTVVGIGALNDQSTIRTNGVLSYKDYMALSMQGGVGDVLCHFFDADGNLVNTDLDSRMISTPMSRISSLENVIAVAAGTSKAQAIYAALKEQSIDVLITDEPTAQKVLELAVNADTSSTGST